MLVRVLSYVYQEQYFYLSPGFDCSTHICFQTGFTGKCLKTNVVQSHIFVKSRFIHTFCQIQVYYKSLFFGKGGLGSKFFHFLIRT